MTGTKILTVGILPNRVQDTQIELAREASKDYNYRWTKLVQWLQDKNDK